MPRRPWWSVLLVCACTSAAPPAPQAAEAKAPEVRAPTPTPTPTPPDAQPSESAEPTVRLLGVLRRMGDRTCPGGQIHNTFVNEHWAVGLVPLHVPPEHEATYAALRGQPVLIEGTVVADSPVKTPAPTEPCPAMQMRSDWIDGPDGIVRRRGPAPLTGLAPLEVRAWTGLRGAQATDQMKLALELDIDESPLKDVRLVVHYEGCGGKPNASAESFEIGALEPRRSRVVTAKLRRDVRGQTSVAASVQLVGAGDGVFVDLDAPLAAIGVAAQDCP